MALALKEGKRQVSTRLDYEEIEGVGVSPRTCHSCPQLASEAARVRAVPGGGGLCPRAVP